MRQGGLWCFGSAQGNCLPGVRCRAGCPRAIRLGVGLTPPGLGLLVGRYRPTSSALATPPLRITWVSPTSNCLVVLNGTEEDEGLAVRIDDDGNHRELWSTVQGWPPSSHLPRQVDSTGPEKVR